MQNYKCITMKLTAIDPCILTRKILVKEDINLVDLGCIMVTAIGGLFEHYFMFETKFNHVSTCYVPECFLDPDDDLFFSNDILLEKGELIDLGEKFGFYYDTGDGWDFSCKVNPKVVSLDSDELAFFLGGTGAGIFEDHIHILNALTMVHFNNDIHDNDEEEIDEEELRKLIADTDPDKIDSFDDLFESFNPIQELEEFDSEIGKEKPFFLERLNIENYKDYFKPIDVKKFREDFHDYYSIDIFNFKQNEGIKQSFKDTFIDSTDDLDSIYKIVEQECKKNRIRLK